MPIVSFVPLFMFALVFGLSMDYEVFLLSRSRKSACVEDPHEQRRRRHRLHLTADHLGGG